MYIINMNIFPSSTVNFDKEKKKNYRRGQRPKRIVKLSLLAKGNPSPCALPIII